MTPLSLRIGVAGGLTETIIERNTPVPIEQTRTFTTVRDGQEKVKIRVYQGESHQADENELLGEFEFAGFRTARRGEVQDRGDLRDRHRRHRQRDRLRPRDGPAGLDRASPSPPASRARRCSASWSKGDTDRVRTARPDEVGPVEIAAPVSSDPETLDEIELVSGVETPPAQLRSPGLDVDVEPEPPAGADDRDVYLGDAGGVLRSDHDPGDSQA